MRTLTIIFLLALCSACSKSNEKLSLKAIEAYDSLQIQLDSLTPDYFHGMEVVSMEDQNYLAFLNDLTNVIYYHDLISGNLEKQISYKVGGDGLRKGIMTFSHVGKDSILLFGKGRTSYLSDASGRILDEFELMDLSFRQSPYATSSSPPIIFDGFIYYNSVVWGDYRPEFHPIFRYSISEEKVSLSDSYPPVYYQKGDWGAFPYDYIYQAFDESNGRIIYSFPNSNTLFERKTALDTLSEVPHSSFGEPIKPPFDSNRYEYDSETWHEALNRAAIFGPIYIDEKSDLLIRFYLLPTNSKLKSPKRKTQLLKYSLTSLELLEVLELPDQEYVSTNAFFVNSKFYVRKKSENEDYISFDLFEY